ncbi:hypothetical protein N5W20_03630 [Candidatus Kirkpatrickella diaphorinae]|uniref:Uncharacterized protein n=1 Tax=Candidatus Kirkpatrickella diaphorinae TaxID=2984322 RepID=A0ABY6GKW0_9PROT|nr:hypothetical protein [Candidatus Kirkpatrickella diaphorinae]UYH51957.1 hypothetical protein N5W20_03630 [Candidatus Kirkpatrickella diaphorinae]
MTPPDKVYKVSFQTPETVFQTGFVSLGHDRDFIRYISGASTEDDSTACVSSMDLWCDVSAISEATARRHPERPIYVYYIRPTENFFNVEASLLYARDVLPPGPAWRQVDDLWRATHHWTEGAWAATAAIAGDQISVARRYYWNDDRPYFGSFFNNPNYYILPPEVSHRPLSVRNATVEAAEVAEAAHGVGFVPAAVVNTACDPQSQSLGTSRTRPCPPVTRLSFGALRTKTIAKLIVSGALMGSTSGQLRSEPGHDEL